MTERYKDCNDCLKGSVPMEVMQGCLSGALDFAPEKVVGASEFYEEFMEEWFERHIEEGLQLPWEFPFKIRPGEMTVWTGIEKSGKSTVLGFVLVCLMAQGERALLASFEVTPVKSLKKLSRQVYGGLIYDKRVVERIMRKSVGERVSESVSKEQAEELQNYREVCRANAKETFDWLGRSLWIYNHVGIGNWRDLGDDMRWARRRHGIRQFVVDNFMRLGIVKDDYAQQAEAVTFFAGLAMELGAHIHLVVHQNKSEGAKGGGGSSGKRSVSGAFEIIANAHNIVEVQRDVRKGEKMSDLFEELKVGTIEKGAFDAKKKELDLIPDGKFVLHAAREGEVQNGSKYLWFLWESQQYADRAPGHREHGPIKFLKHARQEDLEPRSELPTNEEMGM